MNKFKLMKSAEFDLGYFTGCNTPQKLDDAMIHWKNRNPLISPADNISTFCVELISRNWGTLQDDPGGRKLTALVFLQAMEQDGLEKLIKVFGSYLEEFTSQMV